MLLLAPPGAGKGTQGTALAEHFGVAHISSGDLLRAQISAGTEIGRQVSHFLSAGDLVPDPLMEVLLMTPVVEAARAGGYVLDGFPRTVAQSESAATIARELGVELQAVLFLAVPDDELMQRLIHRARGSDDSENTIRHRLEVYHRETAPLVASYRQRGLLREVDGSAAPAAVTAACLAAVADLPT